MPSNDSQAPDALDAGQLVVGLSPKVPKMARYACRFYGHDPNWDEVEDLSQDVLVKLIDNDCQGGSNLSASMVFSPGKSVLPR